MNRTHETSAKRSSRRPSPFIVDFHAHPGFSHDLEGLRREFQPSMRAAAHYDVRYVCICSLADWSESPTPEAIRTGNDNTLALMAEYPDRVLGLCYVNPRYPDAALEEIDRCVVREGMAGIKLWVACRASDLLMDPMAEKAAELGVPILNHAAYLHRNQKPAPNTPADVADWASRHPNTMIVMAHMAACQEVGLADIVPYRNVHIDCAGHEPESGWTELAVKWLGAERVVFGTDTPIRSYGMSLGKVLGAKITPRDRALILGGNARRLLARRLGS